MTLPCGLQLFHIFGVKKVALKYPVIPKAEQLPSFRFFFFNAKAKTKSQASNLFCCREYSVS